MLRCGSDTVLFCCYKMNTHTLLLLLVATVAAHARGAPRAWETQIRCYASANQQGEWYDFNEDISNLATVNFDNTIESIKVTGMWMLYQETDYNTYSSGYVYWIDGIDYTGDVPSEYTNMASSLRYAGSPFQLNEDCWTIYAGEGFTEEGLYGNTDAGNLDRLSGEVSSIVLTGTSSWTFYDGDNFTGRHVCLKPDTHHHHDLLKSLDIGIFATKSRMFPGLRNTELETEGCKGDDRLSS
ncbi:putative Beta/Gamma crystallin-containing protein 1, partial [Homarus americanus]